MPKARLNSSTLIPALACAGFGSSALVLVDDLRHQFPDGGLIGARIQLAELDLLTEFTAARMAMTEHCTGLPYWRERALAQERACLVQLQLWRNQTWPRRALLRKAWFRRAGVGVAKCGVSNHQRARQTAK